MVGVRAQLGGDAAVVTTEGFTAGALRVAADEDIALIRLRPFDPNDGRAFITSMEVTLAMWGATVEGMSVHAPQATDDDLQSINRFPSEVLFVSRDGALIESLESVMRRNAYPMEEGDFPRAVAFEEDRYLALELGHRVPVTGVSWTWRVGVMRHTDVKEFEGEGMIVVEQLDDQGEVHDGRMIVDRELSAWTIDDHRQVRDIGRLDT